MLVAVLHSSGPSGRPRGAEPAEVLLPGSHLVLSHVTSDFDTEKMAEMGKRLNRLLAQKGYYRSQAEVTQFFTGLELLEPRGRPGAALAAGLRDRGRPAGGHVGHRPQERLTREPYRR